MPRKIDNQHEFQQTPLYGKKAALYVRVSSNEFLLSRKDIKDKQKELDQKNAAIKIENDRSRKPRTKKKADGSIEVTDVAAVKQEIEVKVRQSVATQIEDGKKYCLAHGLGEPVIYDKDCDLSGTLGSKDRPSLKQLEKDIDAGLIHTVVVRDVKRLARNSRVLKNFIHEHLLPRGVNLIGREDNVDISTAQGRFFTAILAEIAELEVSSLKQATMRNREKAALDGDLAHCSYTYGFNSAGRRKVEINEKEAAAVRRIFHEYAINKLTCRNVADIITAEKHPLKNGEPGKWHDSRIHAILQNVRYIGKINYGDYKLLNSPFPPIIEQELWDKAQAELKRRSVVGPRTYSSRHLLTGLLKCPSCLERKKKDPSVKPNMFSMTAGKNKIRYYDCQIRHQRGAKFCKGVRINAKKIETFIEEFFGAIAADNFLQFVNDKPNAKDITTKKVARLRTTLAKERKRRTDYPAKLAKFEIPLDIAKETISEMDRIILKVELELQEAESELTEVSKAEQLDALDTLKRWKTLTIQEKRKALKELIVDMVMRPDRLEITLKARPQSPLVVPYTPWRKRRRKPEFPDVTDGLTVEAQRGKLVIRVGREFATIDGKTIRMHLDPIPENDHDKRKKEDEEEWDRIKNDPRSAVITDLME